jgi:hypothetical protein
LTFSTNVFPDELAGAFLLPPDVAYPMAPTENKVASVRYSFFIARPNTTLRFRNQLLDKLQDIIDEGTYYDMAKGLVEVWTAVLCSDENGFDRKHPRNLLNNTILNTYIQFGRTTECKEQNRQSHSTAKKIGMQTCRRRK